MSEEYLIIEPDQMRALARYEFTFDKITDVSEFDENRFVFPGEYAYTTEDLGEALKNIKAKNPTVKEFGDNWYYPMSTLEDAFRIREACGGDDEDENAEAGLLSALPLTSERVFSSVWSGLEQIWSELNDDVRVGELDEISKYIDRISRFVANRGKPLSETDFSDEEKEGYIQQFNDDENLKKASDVELALCRRFVDELIPKDSGFALYLLGYSTYGGNVLYGCDWKTSRDCMIRLYDKTGNPTFANTLGYIYYYGRCTGGVPEYEKAFKEFAISAANGLHEGMYKIADMFLHGYACRKSESAAKFLYETVYEDCYNQFLRGQEGAFADAALRMGNVYLKGIGGEKDPEAAYYYFLQAGYAAKRRAARSDFFGDVNVIMGIKNSLEKTRKELPDDYFSDHISLERPRIFEYVIEKGYRGQITVERREDGKATVRVTRCPMRGQERPEPLLITYTPIDFCELADGLELEGINLKTSFGDFPEVGFRYDSVEWNETDKRLDLYYDFDPVGWISCDEYRLYKRRKEKPSGRLLTFASVAFQPNGRTYDYLCEIPGVEPGDRVIVIGYDGETEVVVQKVYSEYESELGLPLDRYKKIVRKCE